MILKKFYNGGKTRYRNYSVSPGTYFLEEIEVFGETWLCLEGLDIGLNLESWVKLTEWSIKPQCKDAKEYFEKLTQQSSAVLCTAV